MSGEALRDASFGALTANVPYIAFLGITFERWGDEVTGRLAYSDSLIGNPILPALHGGATAGFLEVTAITTLSWMAALEQIEAGGDAAYAIERGQFPPTPKTIDLSIDYLRSGKPQDAYARAIVLRRGRRVANVRVEAWQVERSKPFVAAHGHFLLPQGS